MVADEDRRTAGRELRGGVNGQAMVDAREKDIEELERFDGEARLRMGVEVR